MNRDERKRRFNEAIVNMLYPSPPQLEHESEALNLIERSGSEDLISGSLEDDSGNASTSGDEEHDREIGKMSRAQRKKIRKKKLKEEAIRRGKLIGPLLPPTPTTTADRVDQSSEDPPTVRSNASEKCDELACANSKKIKQRRKAKKTGQRKSKCFYFGRLQSICNFKFCC